MTTNDYTVTWAIDVFNCENPVEAAQQAQDAQLRQGSTANVFTVSNDRGAWRVDLLAETCDVLWERGANQHLTGEEL